MIEHGYKQRGMILLLTLLILALLSLIILAESQLFLLNYKAINQFAKQQKRFQKLELAANYLLKNSKSLTVCDTCTFNYESNNYLYSIEDLGVFACLQSTVNDQSVSSRHWLLTVTNDEKTTLQIRYATSATFQRCEEQRSVIPLGVLSWRIIPALGISQ